MKVTRLHLFLLMLAFVVVTASCMSTASHLYTVRKQVCQFDQFFDVSFDQRIEVELKQPVLTERDVVMLIGAPPTSRVENMGGMVASYRFEQIPTNSSARGSLADEIFEVDLVFEGSENDYLLSGIRTSEVPDEIHANMQYAINNIASVAEQACDIRLDLLSRSTELEIDHEALELLPGRGTIISWMGPPLESNEAVNGLGYEFRLLGADDEPAIARISADYNPSGESPTRIDASFTRYHAYVDVAQATMRISLNRLSD